MIGGREVRGVGPFSLYFMAYII